MELKKEIESNVAGVLTSDLDNLMQKRTVLKCPNLDQPNSNAVEKDI
jgi:hypothetical protein